MSVSQRPNLYLQEKAVVSICQVLVVDSVFIIFTRNVDRKANCDGTRPIEICHQQKKNLLVGEMSLK